ncbi:unnamed protein product [Didymodactylos carnosus]|uniref:Uncharacterized protein n=1 Tax=Didymodactylos carnosus TaxID=1234261 RepID=A0A814UWI7_9BILA|nr:unnamed protein product [Didymodactylos carnosus]CAF1180694.1 unnamed protein product [Didymodactylos carnosus]CAF3944964.1 unnamed protein product [Didymodactylos carnosus]CAF3965369.1 unnamed protein product [Didymodactylos carnosus]
MKSDEKDRQELIEFCKDVYQENATELSKIETFSKEYSSNNAIHWYTRDSFVYRTLNKALRVVSIKTLFLFRSLIGDLHRQLTSERCTSPIRVYRFQWMSKNELNLLSKSPGQFISMNSFLSTTFDPAYVQIYLDDNEPPNADSEPVKFIIDADPQMATEKPFADISSFSQFDEAEVLFMLGSIFRLIEIHRENNGIWSIQLTLCGENDHDLNSLVQRMKREYMKEPDLLELGLVVGRMGKPYEEEKYYIRLLKQLSRDDPLLGHLYYSLGVALIDQGDYCCSLDYLQESLKINREVRPSDYVTIGTTLNSIGEVYRMTGDYPRALESYRDAMLCFQQAHDENYPKLAFIYNNIGIIYDEQNKHDEALTLYEKALNIQLKTLDPTHPDFSGSYNNIGVVYQSKKQFDKALEYYHRALHIQQRSLPSQHPDIAMTLTNIGRVYANRGQLEETRLHWEQAADIYDHRDRFKTGFKLILRQMERVSIKNKEIIKELRNEAFNECKLSIKRRLGCASVCSVCDAKCSVAEEYKTELVEQLPKDHKCPSEQCKCEIFLLASVMVHETDRYIAEAFHGGRYYKTKKPRLAICYQDWTTTGKQVSDQDFVISKAYIVHEKRTNTAKANLVRSVIRVHKHCF